MPRCTKKKRRNRTVCAGSLNKRIEIQSRTIRGARPGQKKFSEEFKEKNEVWAMLETTRGTQLFDGTDLMDGITHIFYIRFQENITQENWILFEDRRFDILDVEDLDENHEFLKLSCNERGNKNVKVNEG